MLRAIHDRLPRSLQTPLRITYRRAQSAFVRAYRMTHPDRQTAMQMQAEFVSRFFDSPQEYEGYVEELADGRASDVRARALEEYARLTGESGVGGVDTGTGTRYYALVRKLEPEVLLETGVCNGLSTFYLLSALDANGTGTLYSIDYPFRADESLEEFRRETFEGYGGAAIPSDKDPGWIIPDELRSRWELTIGRSQRELPHLLVDLDAIEFFAHDSEHSVPCMLFEYELAWEWLRPGGILVSDDVDWNHAFATFTEVRALDHGFLAPGVGYARKHDR